MTKKKTELNKVSYKNRIDFKWNPSYVYCYLTLAGFEKHISPSEKADNHE